MAIILGLTKPLSTSALNPNATDTTSMVEGAKLVISVYPFTAIEPGDLSLVKGEEYTVLDDSQEPIL